MAGAATSRILRGANILATVARATAEDVDHAVAARRGGVPGLAQPSRPRSRPPPAAHRRRRPVSARSWRGSSPRRPGTHPHTGAGEAATADVFRYFGAAPRASRSARCPRSATECSATASASRCRGRDRALERARPPCVPEDRHGALHRQHARAQGGRGRTAGRAAARRGLRSHLPDGVLNVLTGYGEECGGPLLNHPGIAKITFTGSTEVGRIATRAAAERILRCRSNSAASAPRSSTRFRRRRRRRPRHHRDALRPPGPIVHRRPTALRAREHLRRASRRGSPTSSRWSSATRSTSARHRLGGVRYAGRACARTREALNQERARSPAGCQTTLAISTSPPS